MFFERVQFARDFYRYVYFYMNLLLKIIINVENICMHLECR